MKAFEVRFAGVVFPGETLTTDMWKTDDHTVVMKLKTPNVAILANLAMDAAAERA
jgi:acyl dehydratase